MSRSRKQRIEAIHQWRPRRGSPGELVPWDTGEHDWLEGRGEKLYLIHVIDDTTSELMARFVPRLNRAEHAAVVELSRTERPAAFYTDEASLFRTAPKVARDQKEWFALTFRRHDQQSASLTQRRMRAALVCSY